MIRNVCTCPYCGDVSAGVDDNTLELVLAPDRVSGLPCPHLAVLVVAVSALEVDGCVNGDASREWFWMFHSLTGDSVRVDTERLKSTAIAVMCELMPEEVVLETAFVINGGTAVEREDLRPGSGEFPLPLHDGDSLHGIFDGWGLFSQDREAFLRELIRLTGSPSGYGGME